MTEARKMFAAFITEIEIEMGLYGAPSHILFSYFGEKKK